MTLRMRQVNTKEKKLEITVYSKQACPGCEQVKNYLKAAGAHFRTVTAEVDMSVEEMKAEVESISGAPLSTVPFVVVDGKPVGGVPQFMAFFKENKAILKTATQPEEVDLGDLDL